MVLSQIGKKAQSVWLEIQIHFPFLRLDAFVIMPNHIHGIVEIRKLNISNSLLDRINAIVNSPNVEINGHPGTINETRITDKTRITVETRLIASLQPISQPSSKIVGGISGN